MAWFAWGVWGERGRELGKVAAARRTATGVLISPVRPLLPLVVADHQPDLLRHASGLREGLGPGQKVVHHLLPLTWSTLHQRSLNAISRAASCAATWPSSPCFPFYRTSFASLRSH